MQNLRLALQALRRDLRAGELNLLILALVIAVVALSSVGFFTERVAAALKRDANQLMGGDLLISSDHTLPPDYRQEAERLGLRVTETTTFNSMTSTDDVAQLGAVKAVVPGYPLRGSLRIAQRMGDAGQEAGRIPARGEVWLEERLITALQVKPGDQIQLGSQAFRVGALVTFESDRGTGFFSFVPRVMINAADLPATGLLQEGSRYRIRMQFAGDKPAVDQMEAWLKPRLGRGEQLESIDDARPEVRNGLDRANRFLRLAAMLAVVLAAVAIGLSARRYLQRHLDGCAVMRCFGAQRNQLLSIYFIEFALLGLFVGLLGCLGGFLLQEALAGLAAGLVKTALPAPGWLPVWHGLLVSLILMLGFVMPLLVRLTRVPPVRVLRREWGGLEAGSTGVWAIGGAALSALMLWIAGDLRLGLTVVGGFAAALGVFALAAWGVLGLFGRARSLHSAWGLRYGLAALYRRRASSVIQAVALALGLTAILLLTLVSRDLLDAWRMRQPADAPNQFVLNIQPEQREPIARFFAEQGFSSPELLPMVRGRLMSINGRAVSAADYTEERAKNQVEREFNLSWSSRLQAGNQIVGGTWHGDARVPEFSLEQGIGQRLGIKLEDTVEFEIAGQRVSGKISSLRKLEWDSMRVNFFVTAAPGLLDGYPASYITSFHLPEGRAEVVNRMVATWPNLTVIDVGAVVAQVVEMTQRLVDMVNFVLLFALVAGIVVLLAALQSTHDERMYELSVLRTLGARNRQLRTAMLAEFLVLGGIAALLAVGGAVAIGYALSNSVFELPYSPRWLALVAVGLLAAVAVVAAGWLGVRGLLRHSVLEGLRAAS